MKVVLLAIYFSSDERTGEKKPKKHDYYLVQYGSDVNDTKTLVSASDQPVV